LTPQEFIQKAIEEDIGAGDFTSLACIPTDAKSKAVLKVKDTGILAGMEEAQEVFRLIDNTLALEKLLTDGSEIKPGDIAFYVTGSSQSILKAERLALNIMQRMSGIATLTNHYVKAIEGYPAKILDTRKTTPNFRYFEKKAVKIGGGENHRFALYDMMMIKDNHISYAGGIEKAITRANEYQKANGLQLKIEIEAGSMEQVKEILRVGKVHRIMLDNFSVADMHEAVKLIDRRFETEVSGGVTLETVRAIAETGVDYISVGALTHSYKSLDLSLKAVAP
jgi:nicotinate-nucleotide pyrophosphorylase (carboxylating)